MANGQPSSSTSLLSRNVKIEGEINGNENIKIEGHIKGKVKLNGNVFIGTSGVVEADVEATNIVIQGKISGTVLAHQKLELHASGKLIGDFSARSIDIKEGALFEGRSHMITSSEQKPSSSSSASISNSKGK